MIDSSVDEIFLWLTEHLALARRVSRFRNHLPEDNLPGITTVMKAAQVQKQVTYVPFLNANNHGRMRKRQTTLN